MTSYELHLLGLLLSHQRTEGFGLHVWPVADEQGGPSVHLSLHDEEPLFDFRAETLEQACIDALDALGVEYPERPSAERVKEIRDSDLVHYGALPPLDGFDYTVSSITRSDGPLTVLALLEGGAS